MMDELPQVIEPCVKCQDCKSPSSKKKSAHSEGPLKHVRASSGTGDRVYCSIPICRRVSGIHPRALEARPAPRPGGGIPGGSPVALGARLRTRAADKGTERETLNHGDQTMF